MLDEIIDRLKSKSLQEGDYAVLADALREGKKSRSAAPQQGDPHS